MDYLDSLMEASLAEPGFADTWEPYRIMGALVDERFRLGMTQAQIAEQLGTSQAVIARLENDPAKVSFDRVLRYAAAVGVPVTLGPGTLQPKAEPETRGRKPKRASASASRPGKANQAILT